MQFKNKIENTKAYKELNSVQRFRIRKKQNRLAIEKGYKKAKEVGYNVFERMFYFNYLNSQIIKELVENEN
jgi:hypothetical protein